MSFPSLREFMDAVSARWPTALTVLLGSSGVLYTAANGYQYVSDLPSAVLTTCFILAIFAGASLASTSIEATFSALKRVIGWMRSNSVKTERLAMLLDLPFDEHLVMSMLFTNKKQAFHARVDEPSLIGLIQRGLIIKQNGTHSMLEWPYLIPQFVWNAMAENRDMFTVPEEHQRNPFIRSDFGNQIVSLEY